MKGLRWLRRDLPCRRIARWAIFVTLSFPLAASAYVTVKMTGSWITTSSTITTPATAQTIDFRVIAENGSNESVHIAADNIWLIPNDIFLNMVFEDSFE